jgi:hypothetical protein
VQKKPKIHVIEQVDGKVSDTRTFRRTSVAQKRRRLADAPPRLPAVLLKYRHSLSTESETTIQPEERNPNLSYYAGRTVPSSNSTAHRLHILSAPRVESPTGCVPNEDVRSLYDL